jgi:uncharacterized protein
MAAMSATRSGSSALALSRVRHRRHRPRTHRLALRTFHVLVDIDELPLLDRRIRGFAHNRRAPMAIHDADHLGASGGGGPAPLRERVRALLADQGVALPDGPLQLLCHPRTFGHVFDPVAWWFAYHPDGRLGLVLAEVTSTFGDRVVHVLDELHPGPAGAVTATARKRLHVSPFLPVDGLTYRFTIRAPGVPVGDRALVHMEVVDADGVVLDATQQVALVPFTSRRVLGLLLRYPFVSLRTLLWIHVHALLIWRKRVPFHRRPEPPAGALRVRGDARARRRASGSRPRRDAR